MNTHVNYCTNTLVPDLIADGQTEMAFDIQQLLDRIQTLEGYAALYLGDLAHNLANDLETLNFGTSGTPYFDNPKQAQAYIAKLRRLLEY